MQIPTSFRLSGKKYTVEVTDGFSHKYIGRVNYKLRSVTIALNNPLTGRTLPQAEVSNSFWHEVTHAILYDMNHALYSNERFVSAFADRLAEAVRTAKL